MTRTFNWNSDLNTCVQIDQMTEDGVLTVYSSTTRPRWVCCAARAEGVTCAKDNIPAGYVSKLTAYDDPKSFNDAQLFCEASGTNGSLATIKNQAEMDGMDIVPSDTRYWVGHYDWKDENWGNVDGTDPGFYQWADGEPNNF